MNGELTGEAGGKNESRFHMKVKCACWGQLEFEGHLLVLKWRFSRRLYAWTKTGDLRAISLVEAVTGTERDKVVKGKGREEQSWGTPISIHVINMRVVIHLTTVLGIN